MPPRIWIAPPSISFVLCNVSLSPHTTAILAAASRECLRMPTPSEDTLSTHTPAATTSAARSAYPSCPPEEIRDHRVPREERSQSASIPAQPSEEAEGLTGHVDGHRHISQEMGSGRDGTAGAQEIRSAAPSTDTKDLPLEDAGVPVAPSSPTVGSPDDSDARLAQSMSSAALSPRTSHPQYLHFPELDLDRVRPQFCQNERALC